jgi:hypothetical protein
MRWRSEGEGKPMAEPTDPLVLDLVEWIAREPRLYSEVIESWRTSCPRLTIWEDAVDRGYVTREAAAGAGVRVAITARGKTFLRAWPDELIQQAHRGTIAISLLLLPAPLPLTHRGGVATFMHPHRLSR